MEDLWLRFVEDMVDRVSGPMSFRLVLQPVMAAIYAITAGIQDAKAGKPPYLWAMFTHPLQRRELLKDAWNGVGRVFVVAIVLDVVYQIIVMRFVYLGEVIFVALMLAIVPYVILRGLVTRIAHRVQNL